jgi:hypothetical protein
MADDFIVLVARIRRVCPGAKLERLTASKANAIRKKHPGVPEHYLAFLREVGWGSLGGSLMLYSGLIEPGEVFDAETACRLNGFLFFGDNFSGDMFGFDIHHNWRIVRADHHGILLTHEGQTVAEFVTEWIADWEG